MHEKRKFPRFAVTKPVVCRRYGKQITMRTQNISLRGLKLEASSDLSVGETLYFDILTNGTRIHCKGTILAIEDLRHKVHARLHLTPTSDSQHTKLSDYLHSLYWGRLQRWIIGGVFILVAYIAYLIIRTYL
jgi:hypothetical protein